MSNEVIKKEAYKLFIGFLIAVLSAASTYWTTAVIPVLEPHAAAWMAVLTPIVTGLILVARKFLIGYHEGLSKKEDPSIPKPPEEK